MNCDDFKNECSNANKDRASNKVHLDMLRLLLSDAGVDTSKGETGTVLYRTIAQSIQKARILTLSLYKLLFLLTCNFCLKSYLTSISICKLEWVSIDNQCNICMWDIAVGAGIKGITRNT